MLDYLNGKNRDAFGFPPSEPQNDFLTLYTVHMYITFMYFDGRE